MMTRSSRTRSLAPCTRSRPDRTRIPPPLCWATHPKPEQSLHPFDVAVAVAAATPELGIEVDGVHVEAARPRSLLNIDDAAG